ncbi:hypothetical protein N7510_011415 [Penicillium lagena]|uniref:uncharacterized protein n=1 Tax=Penicillium lagena TaxID=94218 RepID=UPI00253FB4CC|nr:uncharacterized protein N7510_011415 [Penicillium lagena]KAJ5601881.1 hypothetical protein N7510_011415 [Penicillium lagena]
MMHKAVLSPKRKREPSESDYYSSPAASPTSTVSVTSYQEARLREEEDLGRNSPRAAVAGRFGELAIHGERLSDPPTGPATPPASGSCLSDGQQNPKPKPDILPAVSAQTEWDNESAAISPPRKQAVPSSRKQQSPASSPSKARKQRLSPPLPDHISEDPLVWHDSEITGHSPSDPTDDGYGINGIGFKPTAAIAWARSQKRQQQVAQWKSREAREAREKRRQRRHEDGERDSMRSIHERAIQKRVKFDV